MTHGQHASASAEWWTPPEIVDPARELFGGFDLDPASCEEANRIVKARRFYTKEDDGLTKPWVGDVVWVNGPSKKGEERLWEWWCYGAKAWALGSIGRLWFVVFNPSSFLTVAQEHAYLEGVPPPQHAARVEFRKRVRFCRRSTTLGLPGVEGADIERGDAPPHGSALLLLTRDTSDYARLAKAYAHLGETLVPYQEFM